MLVNMSELEVLSVNVERVSEPTLAQLCYIEGYIVYMIYESNKQVP